MSSSPIPIPQRRETPYGFHAYTYVATVYSGTDASEFQASMASMLTQTLPPAEVVVVCDGPVPEAVEEAISDLDEQLPAGMLKVSRLEENCGPGYAAAIGIEAASCEYVARLDADDISEAGRIESQLAQIECDPGLACVGSLVVERQKHTGGECLVELPETDEEIRVYTRRRCPCRQSTLLLHRTAVLAVGNYRELRFAEDWDICNRLLQAGYRCYNVQEPLVTMMVDDDFYARRGGTAVLRRILSFKLDMLREGQMGPVDFAVSAGSSLVVCLMPNRLREFVYKKLLRGGHS